MFRRYVGENKGDVDVDAAAKTFINKGGKKRNFEFEK
jgi:hypothetical protein